MTAPDVDEDATRVVVRDLTVAGPHGDVPARLYRSPGRLPLAGLVWVHGGAFVSGDLDMPEADWVAGRLAARGIAVLSLDYRKAKDGVQYPVPSDDVLAGWTWAVEHVDVLGVPVQRLHLGGASAGGNLVAGVTKRLRDGAGRLPTSLVLAYPVVHPELPVDGPVDVAGLEELAGDHYFSPELTRRMTVNYVGGDERLLTHPYAFPSNGAVGGQPPVYVMNCEYDSLRASGHAYAVLLAEAGVIVREETLARTQHGALNRPGGEALRSLDGITSWILEGPDGPNAG
ncbi:alpha/beta hydrolase fold domain-containing protein [Kribbella solani]|uniref:Acetyl esterase/lipase n=1 Tax=Kribbella solani TaxID=236067 RepID=A0A841DII4_9ACTN|nr:alpha/beta hydrolase fold domain-containing protein [Kribbella solani]MBB5977349.1 acetyl esterase/lipase [Kribbella solani]